MDGTERKRNELTVAKGQARHEAGGTRQALTL